MRAVRTALIVPTAWLFMSPIGVMEETSVSGPFVEEVRLGLVGAFGKKDSKHLLMTAGVAVCVGAAVGVGKFLYDWGWETFRRTVSVRVEFDSRDESFRWVMEWLADNRYAQLHSGIYVSNADKKRGGYEPAVQLTPGEGLHWLTTDSGKWVFIRRQSRGGRGGGGQQGRNESLSVIMLGHSRSNVDGFIEECRQQCLRKDRTRTLIYSGGEHGSWNMAQSKLRRPMSTVFLPREQSAALLLDAREFLASEQYYAERGTPWKRGYLLYGPPGTGKSSIVRAMAGELGMNIYSVSLGSAGMKDTALQDLMVSAPRHCILLIEDIDAAFRTLADDGDALKASNLSLSGLLNAIDGVISQEGSLLFLTTNNLDELPPRLLRSGRIDFRMEFRLAMREQIRDIFRLYYGHGSPVEDAFLESCPENVFSCSDLQSIMTMHKTSPEKALEELKKRVDRENK